jgi:hypothetical protein
MHLTVVSVEQLWLEMELATNVMTVEQQQVVRNRSKVRQRKGSNKLPF